MKKVAIVTGASRGIGAAIAQLLAEKDYAVCVNYLSADDKANEIVHTIKQKGGQAIAVKADMGQESAILNLFKQVDEELGSVTALVNNAGVNGGIYDVEEVTLERLQQVYATNVFGAMIACREAIKRMKQHHGGGIVNITSQAAKFGGTRMAHYASSKAAVETFTIAAAREVAANGIRINAISPGVIDTDIHLASPPDRVANLIKTLPMGRMGTGLEVAQLAYWLLSDDASYISGAILPVTGAR